MQCQCLGRGAFDLSKIVPAIWNKQGKGTIYRSINLDLRQQKFVEIPSSFKGSHRDDRLSALAPTKLGVSIVEAEKRVSTYRFHTEGNGQLKVLIEKKNNGFRVRVELLSCQESELVMVWGLFRSDSSSFMPLDFQGSNPDVQLSTIETPFIPDSSGMRVVELDFESRVAPFYLSFVLKSQTVLDSNTGALEIRSHRKTSFVVPVGFGSGNPFPLGLSFLEDGSMNIALFSRSAESVILCFYNDGTTANKPIMEIDLDPYVNRSGDIWHASISSDLPFPYYGYLCKTGGNQDDVLLDPYAKVIGNMVLAGSQMKFLATLSRDPPFDWGRDIRPYIPMEELIVYRLNTTQFAGTFNGITEKLHHIKSLGVNAILMEPVFLYDDKKGPYFPLHFFSPGTPSESSNDFSSISKSLKEMVKNLHSNGMEIILEVVFTHTSENASLYEIDKSSYYHVKSGDDALASKKLLNCNYPIVIQMILDSLRHWVTEFHIDGFCFMNSSALLRGFHGEILSRPPLVEAIAFDPILSKVKIVADSWDPHDNEPKETVFPHWKKWAEMNHKYCLDIRNFVRGEGVLSSLATRLCGSADMFLHGRGPAFSFNFVARNSGLTLVDLVSYSDKTELVSECSWNCGEEGPTNISSVLQTRVRQIRNFIFILFVSPGVPVINMGDECGLSSGGSPYYKDRKPFDWSTVGSHFGVQTVKFISFLIALRFRRRDLLQRSKFLREENIEWHGKDLGFPLWDDITSKFLAMTLKASVLDDDDDDDDDDDESVTSSSSGSVVLGGDLFMAFNGGDLPVSIMVPSAPVDSVWHRLVDTGLSYPGFFSSDGVLFGDGLISYEMQSHSCALFEARAPPRFNPNSRSAYNPRSTLISDIASITNLNCV